MTNQEFLERIIDDGIEAAKRDYDGDDPIAVAKREGSVAGFEACRGKTPTQLASLLLTSQKATTAERPAAMSEDIDPYWRARCFEAEVEWVCNCMSAALLNVGLPVIVNPTSRGVFKATEILGVSGE